MAETVADKYGISGAVGRVKGTNEVEVCTTPLNIPFLINNAVLLLFSILWREDQTF